MQMSYNQMNMNMKMNVIPVSVNVTHSVPVCSVPFPKPRKIKSGVRSLNQGRPWPLKKQRGKCICRAELSLSQDAPFAIAIGACMLNSLLFPYVKDEQEQEDEENAAIGPTDARFAVMTIISFIPYFNWLCVMAELYRSKGIYAPPTGPSKISKTLFLSLQRALWKVSRIPGNRRCYLGARVTFVSFVPMTALLHHQIALQIAACHDDLSSRETKDHHMSSDFGKNSPPQIQYSKSQRPWKKMEQRFWTKDETQ
ncbi:hypothetical protein Cgig2_000851 [Carnegiea gigantea]|uniref:Uncharacterized protein n=1 Tax=Carnegiea gigantea TaxID=171969 RepID=A0A9Q1GP36_9CARY|nr:hypothetical protein Cgig2_000851 [Carnegiea gigantea]